MRTKEKCLLLVLLSLVSVSVLFVLAGTASAAVTYSMTNVVSVSAGAYQQPIGALVITLDPATAAISAGSSVDFSLPASPSGFELGIGAGFPPNSLIGASGSISLVYSPLGTRAVRVIINSLALSANASEVQIVLPLTITVPPGFTGSIDLSAYAPNGSIFPNNNGIAVSNLGTGSIQVTPNTYNFGNVAVGGSEVQTFTVTDIGGADVTVNSLSLSGLDSGSFQVQSDQVTGKNFAPGSSSNSGTFEVVFKPTTAGTLSAILVMSSTDPYVPMYDVSLTGTATQPGSPPVAPPTPVTPPTTPVTPVTPVTPPAFSDMQGNWALPAVNKLAAMGIMSGYPDGTFRPDNDMTRAEAVVVLAKALNLTARSSQGLMFQDAASIPGWASGYVAAAFQAGLVHGYQQPDGTQVFAPNNPVSRDELSALIATALEQRLGSITPASLMFSDNAAIPGWAQADIGIMLAKGLISGYPDHTFRAGNDVTRAEAASIVSNMLNVL